MKSAKHRQLTVAELAMVLSILRQRHLELAVVLAASTSTSVTIADEQAELIRGYLGMSLAASDIDDNNPINGRGVAIDDLIGRFAID